MLHPFSRRHSTDTYSPSHVYHCVDLWLAYDEVECTLAYSQYACYVTFSSCQYGPLSKVHQVSSSPLPRCLCHGLTNTTTEAAFFVVCSVSCFPHCTPPGQRICSLRFDSTHAQRLAALAKTVVHDTAREGSFLEYTRVQT